MSTVTKRYNYVSRFSDFFEGSDTQHRMENTLLIGNFVICLECMLNEISRKICLNALYFLKSSGIFSIYSRNTGKDYTSLNADVWNVRFAHVMSV